ncbi:MAG: hypothetical protein JSU63_09130, partial [Phycisphaerales bacterium]
MFTDLDAAFDVVVSDGIVYAADREASNPPSLQTAKGLAVIDFATDVSDPTLVGTLSTHGAV